MAGLWLSPRTKQRCRPAQQRNGKIPSTNTNGGSAPRDPLRRCRARSMAHSVASRMPWRSISAAEAWPRAHPEANSLIRGTSSWRRRAERALLSVRPAAPRGPAARAGKTTAAAKTGPNQQPRPTSSTPAAPLGSGPRAGAGWPPERGKRDLAGSPAAVIAAGARGPKGRGIPLAGQGPWPKLSRWRRSGGGGGGVRRWRPPQHQAQPGAEPPPWRPV